MNRLKEKYQKEVLPELQKDLDIKNVHAVPKLVKVIVNMGMGDMSKNKELSEQAKQDLGSMTGQAPSVREARISVASFGVRRGMPVGLKTTLRGERMYSFLDRLFSIVLPRLRDFRGVSAKAFDKSGIDKSGNYTLGLPEHTVFPEIDIAKSKSLGLEITVVTTAKEPNGAKRLLELLGMPFEKADQA
jgi:large subunit ribosomal protein L5